MKIEIGQYREVNKGALKAFFTLCIYDGIADRQYVDCQYFVHGERQWWTFAQKIVKQADGSKPKYFSYTKYMNKAYVDELQNTVLKDLQKKARESNDIPTSDADFSFAHNEPTNVFPSEPSVGW